MLSTVMMKNELALRDKKEVEAFTECLENHEGLY